jgi:hypothetical protein
MRNFLSHFLKDGRLAFTGALLTVVFGLAITYLSIAWLPSTWLKVLGLSIGLGVALLGSFSGRATALGIPPPFTNDPLGWRKAMKSYDSQVSGESGNSEKQ